jgi:hypothetical protein
MVIQFESVANVSFFILFVVAQIWSYKFTLEVLSLADRALRQAFPAFLMPFFG